MPQTELPALPHSIDPASLAALPRGPGVYIFKGDGTLPIYIGKSVDIRSRVLAHLRARDEAGMIAQTRRIDTIETAGEIGALLLEARLIKQLSPLHNVRLRRLSRLCSIRLLEQAGALSPEVVSGNDVAIGEADGLYGLFSSVHAARTRLQEIADQHRLCRGLLGLERIGKRGCFGVQVRTCDGACVGREERSAHDRRLLDALTGIQVHAWPYPGAVDLVEQNGDWIQRHRLLNWRHTSTWCSKSGETEVPGPHGFDMDTYRILARSVMMGTARVELAKV